MLLYLTRLTHFSYYSIIYSERHNSVTTKKALQHQEGCEPLIQTFRRMTKEDSFVSMCISTFEKLFLYLYFCLVGLLVFFSGNSHFITQDGQLLVSLPLSTECQGKGCIDILGSQTHLFVLFGGWVCKRQLRMNKVMGLGPYQGSGRKRNLP